MLRVAALDRKLLRDLWLMKGQALAIGVAASSQLFGVAPTDPVTFAGVTLGVLVVAALATVVPARRALGVDPMQTLRAE